LRELQTRVAAAVVCLAILGARQAAAAS
jgi:hypothetical protein